MKYSEEDKERLFNEILTHIRLGNSLTSTLKLKGMPCDNTFDKWCSESEDRMTDYVRAREKRAETIFEQILQIADYNGSDLMGMDDNGKPIINNDVIQRNRLQIDARKWMLGKMQPKKYGDKLDVTSDGDKIQNVNPILEVKIIKPDEE